MFAGTMFVCMCVYVCVYVCVFTNKNIYIYTICVHDFEIAFVESM